MTGPSAPEVVATRTAVRDGLRSLALHRPAEGEQPPPGDGALVLVACSGGADSLALAAATAWVAPRLGLRAGAVVVDHGLQPGSESVARATARACADLGLAPVDVLDVVVGSGSGRGGPEKAARDARLAAFADAARRHGAAALLLGHTRGDQAETVLLGLSRGSGARSLAGMAAMTPLPGSDAQLLRPLLALPRDVVRAAAARLGLPVWHDPQNDDPAFARARVRQRALPALTDALGPGTSAALARTARLLRADADALDGWADQVMADSSLVRSGAGVVEVDAAGVAALPEAVRTRVLMRAALAAGVPANRITSGHVDSLDALVVRWRGQGAVSLPSGVAAERRCGRLRIAAPPTGA